MDRPAEPRGSRGTVFNVQHYSLHDGPGLRTTVFLKGCPLRCHWCSNPEGMRIKPQLSYRETLCIGMERCGSRCRDACGKDAIGVSPSGRAAIDFSRCAGCVDCAASCPSKALECVGEPKTCEQVMQEVEKDGAFYRRSGGGLTLSGGECALQPEFAESLLKQARERGLDTSIETSGFAKWDALARIAVLADTVHYDIKHVDAQRHAEYTGVHNKTILDNFVRLAALLPPGRIIARTPVVPGFNDTVADLEAIAEFVAGAGGQIAHELLPYHRFGEGKYRGIGLAYPAAGIDARADGPGAAVYHGLVALARLGRVLVPSDRDERAQFFQRLGSVDVCAASPVLRQGVTTCD